MSNKEDQAYSNPKTQEKENIDLNQGQKAILGFTSIPGNLYTSGVICTSCPLCSNVGPTKVESTWSVKSCLFCYYYGGYWGCYQLLKGKDFIPKDADHYCTSCNKIQYKYRSCDVDVSEGKEESK